MDRVLPFMPEKIVILLKIGYKTEIKNRIIKWESPILPQPSAKP